MKRALCALSLFGLGILSVPSSASAQCVASDVSVQVSISGSKEPATQRSDVQMNALGPCTGNVSHTSGVQTRVGGETSLDGKLEEFIIKLVEVATAVG